MTLTHLAASVTGMPTWARRTVYGAAGALFLAGFGMSAYYLTQLAMWFGVALPFALLLPLALDAGAIVGVVMWVTGGEGSEIETFGRRLARQMIAASVIGNALDRVLTFSPGATAASPEEGLAVLLTRTQALVELLTTGDTGETLAAWALLTVSVAIGVVFPVLAYRMAHALILTRKAADTARARTAPAAPRTVAEEVQHRAQETPEDEEQEATGAEEPPVDDTDTGPLPRVYVHDTRDLEPGTSDWQDRYDRIPGASKSAKLEYWLERCWSEGHEPVLSTEADRVVDGRRIGDRAKRSLAKRGVLPPSERTEDRELTSA